MKRVAVFGKPGGGKSTFSAALSQATAIPHHPLDLVEYNKDGTKVDPNVYHKLHDKVLDSEQWIIDGLGSIESFQKRLEYADTLIYIDLPYTTHYWWITKRLLKSFFSKPRGWPEGSSVLKGTISSYNTLRICPKFWNDEFLKEIKARHSNKSIIVFKSVGKMNEYLRHGLHTPKPRSEFSSCE